MAPFVVGSLPVPGTSNDSRVAIFPGAAATSVYTADTPFWVGYGFTADDANVDLDGATTRFELDVDGDPAPMRIVVESDGGHAVRMSHVAEFPDGLPPGWHELSGRWYDGGSLVLSSRATIQFVEA